MEKITDKKIYLAIDERIDRVVEQLEDKINKCFNKFDKIDDRLDDLESKNYQLRSELDGIYKVLEMDACDIQKLQDKVFDGYTIEQKTPSKKKKYIHYKWEKNLDMHEIREEMCLIISNVWKGLNLDNATDGEPCDCICQSSINDKYIKVDDRVIKFINTAVNEKLNKMEDE